MTVQAPTPIPINVPEGAKVFNRLYDTTDLELLDEDILTVVLKTGYRIDVGWFPANDRDGCYKVTLTNERSGEKHYSTRARSANDVAFFVQELAEKYD